MTRLSMAGVGLTLLGTLQGCAGDGGGGSSGSVSEQPPAVATKALSCAEITTAALGTQGVTVTSAAVVPGGSFTPPGATRAITGLPEFCRVAATLRPSADSDIKVEIWMPTGWNGKLVSVGNGGLAGTISYTELAASVTKGYTSVSTDTGHTAADTTWLPSQQKQYEYMTGSIHEMTVTAKNLVQRHYGRAQTRAYYQGCSTGGGQGFSAVQRFPADFDGVIAGAPQNFPTHFRPALVYDWQLANATPSSVLGTTTMANVTKAVLSQCGGAAATSDGFLMNPQTCNFDPASMQCAPGTTGDTCLTPEQVTVVRSIYAGLKSPTSGLPMWPGFAPGSEQPVSGGGWQAHGTAGGQPFSTSSLFFRIGVLEQPSFDLKQMDFNQTVKKADQRFGTIINSIDTDIRPFASRGGKLLMYHGWIDPLIAPQNTINYYEGVVDTLGSRSATEASTRLFMVPGMAHCRDGPGATNVDLLEVLDAWVDKGTAPTRIVASSTTTPTFTRPLCPYPQVAEYIGSGDRNQAANWQCVGHAPVADREFYRRGLNIF